MRKSLIHFTHSILEAIKNILTVVANVLFGTTLNSTNIDGTAVMQGVRAFLTGYESVGDTYETLLVSEDGRLQVESVGSASSKIYYQYDNIATRLTYANGIEGAIIEGKLHRALEIVQEKDSIFGGSFASVASSRSSWVWGMGPLEFIRYPTAPEVFYASSTSSNDTLLGTGARQLLIVGWVRDTSTGVWNKGVDLINMNGQTPVAGTVPFARFIQGQVIQSGAGDAWGVANEGFIWITSSYYIGIGGLFTGGVPHGVVSPGVPSNVLGGSKDNIIIATGKAGYGALLCGYVTSIPGATALFTEHILGSAVETNQSNNIMAEYWTRSQPFDGIGTQDTGNIRVALLTNVSNTGSASAHQSSFPPIQSSIDGLQATDVTITCARIDGNTDNFLAFSNLSGYLITDF